MVSAKSSVNNSTLQKQMMFGEDHHNDQDISRKEAEPDEEHGDGGEELEI